MKVCETFTANIYLGLKAGYDGEETSVDVVRRWLEVYCNEVKLGVTLTKTEFIYVDGGEPGVIVGLINYPRFPKPVSEIKTTALVIAQGLLNLCSQERVSVVFSDITVMVEKIES